MSGEVDVAMLDELRMRAWSAGGAGQTRWEAFAPQGWQDDRTLIVARNGNYSQTVAEFDDIDEAAHVATADPVAVLALVNEVERLRAAMLAVEALTAGRHDLEEIEVCDIRDALRAALDSQRHTETPDASQAADGPLSASEGHVSATNLARAAARTKHAARERVERGGRA